MKPLQILLPMGGLGQRFRDQGYETPKPLIEVEGTPMFLRALASFDAYKGPKEFLFVVRQDAEDQYHLATSIQDLLPESKITLLQQNTRGAAETAMLARDDIDPKLPLVVMDCDFEFTSADYFMKLDSMVQNADCDGILLSFYSNKDLYSYAKVGADGFVTETAEKKVISKHALMGAYCFASGGLFIEAADKLMQLPLGPDMKEYYISYVYGQLLVDKKHIRLADIDSVHSFGTPGELQAYLSSSNH